MMPLNILLVVGLTVILYFWRLDRNLATPLSESNGRCVPSLTSKEVKDTYVKVQKRVYGRDHGLPKRKDRRYIVLGGSGLVGRGLVVSLLANGTPPLAIRIIDLNDPLGAAVASGEQHGASRVPIFRADAAHASELEAAMTALWPDETIAQLPLTVFYAAATVGHERSRPSYNVSARSNIEGTSHVLETVRRTGASILIMTSSSVVENREVHWFPWPWVKYPTNFMQSINGSDFDSPLRADERFATECARRMAREERLVCNADSRGKKGLHTGAIRPARNIYGSHEDSAIWRMLSKGWTVSFNAAFAQNWVSYVNVAMAHLQLEDALLGKYAHRVSGRPYLVTDDGQAVTARDVYTILKHASVKGLNHIAPPPIILLAIGYVVEWWAALAERFAGRIKAPGSSLRRLQVGELSTGVTTICDDSVARKMPKDGGIGYAPVHGTVEGMCNLVREWNESYVAQAMDRVKRKMEAKGE